MIFKVAYVKDNQPLIKMVLDNKDEVWAETTQAVYDFAKKNFSENEECDFDYEEKSDGSYYVSKIIKKGNTSNEAPKKRGRGRPKKTTTTSKDKFCGCGKKIKDVKYSKCYDCNQKKKETKPQESEDNTKYCDCGVEIKDVKYNQCYNCNQNKDTTKEEGKRCECGAVIKNEKYNKCYNCNKKKGGSKSSGQPDYEKGAPYGSVTEGEAIRRNKLAILGSIAPAIATAMAGRIEDADVLVDMILEAHTKIYEKLFG